MMRVGCLGAVGAAAADRDLCCAPGVGLIAGSHEREGKSITITARNGIIPLIGHTATPIFNTQLALPLTVLSTRRETTVSIDTLPENGQAHCASASASTGFSTSATVFTITLQVFAHTTASPTSRAAQRDLRVLGSTLPFCVEKLSTKCSLRVDALKLNRLNLVDVPPRNCDRVGSLLPRGHKRSIGKRAITGKESTSCDIIKSIWVAHRRGEHNGLAFGNTSHVRREREKEGSAVGGRSCAATARRSGSGSLRRVHGRRSGTCCGRSARHRFERIRRFCRGRIVASATREPHEARDQ